MTDPNGVNPDEPTLDTTTGTHAEDVHENITDLPAPRDNRGEDEADDDGQ